MNEAYGFVIHNIETDNYYCSPGYYIWHNCISKAKIYDSTDKATKSPYYGDTCEIIKVRITPLEVVSKAWCDM